MVGLAPDIGGLDASARGAAGVTYQDLDSRSLPKNASTSGLVTFFLVCHKFPSVDNPNYGLLTDLKASTKLEQH